MKTIAFVVCCKESKYIYDCVESINALYQDIADIIIVDSCSDDKKYFELSQKFSNVSIEDICNKNYEYGAILHGFKKYNQYEKYVFIQDALKIHSKIVEIDVVNDNEVYLFGKPGPANSGWALDPSAKLYFYERNPKIPKIDGKFLICQWNCFLINKNTFNKIINSDIFCAAEPAHNKLSSRAWERVWSIVFKENGLNIKHISPTNKYSKIFGKRQ